MLDNFAICLILLTFVAIVGCTHVYNSDVHQCNINNLSVNATVESNGFYMKDPITPMAKYHVRFNIHNFENYNLTNIRIDSIVFCTDAFFNPVCYNETPTFGIETLDPDETKMVTYDFNVQQRSGSEKFQLISYHHVEDTCIWKV